jgi:hypothetical protein
MSLDEAELGRVLRTADTPPGLTLEVEPVMARALRAQRARRARRAAGAALPVALVVTGTLWATGTAIPPLDRVLPAAPWAGCQGVVDTPEGSVAELDRISYATLDLTTVGVTDEVVIGLDTDCPSDEGPVVAYAGADAGATQPDAGATQLFVEASVQVDLDALIAGTQVRPGIATAGESEEEVLYGVVAQEATGLRMLGSSPEAPGGEVLREPMPGQPLDAYVVTGVNPGMLTALLWEDAAGTTQAEWFNIVARATFSDPADDASTFVVQDRGGAWWVSVGTVQAGPIRTDLAWAAVVPSGDRSTVVALVPEEAVDLQMDLTNGEMSGPVEFAADLETDRKDGWQAVRVAVSGIDPGEPVAVDSLAWIDAAGDAHTIGLRPWPIVNVASDGASAGDVDGTDRPTP